jgi:hypothetical protein
LTIKLSAKCFRLKWRFHKIGPRCFSPAKNLDHFRFHLDARSVTDQPIKVNRSTRTWFKGIKITYHTFCKNGPFSWWPKPLYFVSTSTIFSIFLAKCFQIITQTPRPDLKWPTCKSLNCYKMFSNVRTVVTGDIFQSVTAWGQFEPFINVKCLTYKFIPVKFFSVLAELRPLHFSAFTSWWSYCKILLEKMTLQIVKSLHCELYVICDLIFDNRQSEVFKVSFDLIGVLEHTLSNFQVMPLTGKVHWAGWPEDLVSKSRPIGYKIAQNVAKPLHILSN